mmetsp:Transcript_7298/g.26108  ORF Transcript_7298/g.26108 Transcript_7298/m.26108 type:complete len:241 (-) Transcript_7298:223-945(-)
MPRRDAEAAATLVVALALACAAVGAAAAQHPQGTMYLIRHGEKPAHGDGLTEAGEQRAQCLVGFFGKDRAPAQRPRHIWAQQVNSHQTSRRAEETVQPLATYLNLTVDTTFPRDDYLGVAAAIENASAAGGADWVGLLCWEHKALSDIAGALGIAVPPIYPSSSFDELWTVNLTATPPTLVIGAEHCTSPDSGGLSTGADVAIVVGGVLALFAAGFVCRRRRRQAAASAGQGGTPYSSIA